MKVTMDDSRITSIAQLKEFLKGSEKIVVSLEDARLSEKYGFIEKTIKQFSYQKLSKKDKRVIVQYLRKVTGYKHTQLFRLIKRSEKGSLVKQLYKRIKPHRVYTTTDTKLLEKTDELHLRLSEDATKEVLRREFETSSHQKNIRQSLVSPTPILQTFGILQFTKVHGSTILKQDKYQ